ncbi:hypothetical protein BDZ89DRAFT_487328 [Hymenopellis radicata]|nr:hypothetical protein BDZ89DRAFT_487328 [Hymenopellis radicata]
MGRKWYSSPLPRTLHTALSTEPSPKRTPSPPQNIPDTQEEEPTSTGRREGRGYDRPSRRLRVNDGRETPPRTPTDDGHDHAEMVTSTLIVVEERRAQPWMRSVR